MNAANPSSQATIYGRFQQTAGTYPNHTAVQNVSTSFCFSEIDQKSNQIASALQDHGCKVGTTVALFALNSEYYVIAYLAILKTGATVVPINIRLNPKEILFILQDSKTTAIIYDDIFSDSVKQIQQAHRDIQFLITIGTNRASENDLLWHEILSCQREAFVQPENQSTTSIASILYTSGTTGRPKGAMLSHSNLLANTTSVFEALKLEQNRDRILVVLPMFHSFAATVGLLTPLLHGCTCIPVPKFDPELTAEFIYRCQATIFLGVPTMYNLLLNLSEIHIRKFATIRYGISGGAAMAPELMERFERRFGFLIYEGDGPTECGPVTCVNPIEGKRKRASVGLPVANVQMKIFDNQGAELPIDEVGEICVKGPNVMQGYWNLPEGTKNAFYGDWYRTGDLGYCDADGYFYIVDRIKDMIIVNGVNVYPRMIEDVIYKIPGVQEVAVVGHAHELHGEVPVAYISTQKHQPIDAEAVQDFCKDHLGKYAIPKTVIFMDELPKNASGKILKRQLRKLGELERGVDPDLP